MADVVYRSAVRIEPQKGAVRAAHLPEEQEPILYGVHGAVAEHYNMAPDGHATTLDHVVAAAAG